MSAEGSASLISNLLKSAQLYPERTAFEDFSSEHVSYSELVARVSAVETLLSEIGVDEGDRVAFILPRSVDAVVLIYGILARGAVYVPIVAAEPDLRVAKMLNDCEPKIVITAATRVVKLNDITKNDLKYFAVEDLMRIVRKSSVPIAGGWRDFSSERAAYIAYTSGSTGFPKGVVMSERAVTAFVDWYIRANTLSAADRFAMVTTFSFCQGTLDIHATIRLGATGVIVSEELARFPRDLVQFFHANQITACCGAAALFNQMLLHGEFSSETVPTLKVILFAGSVLPIDRVRVLRKAFPNADIVHCYGSTEIGICTSYALPQVLQDLETKNLPIGTPCEGFTAQVDAQGELWISGVQVMNGYWKRPEANAERLVTDSSKRVWFRTGDIVREHTDGTLTYVSRNDRMIKKYGQRIELGEIESALRESSEIAAVSIIDEKKPNGETELIAFVVRSKESSATIIDLKKFSALRLPPVMVPDRFVFVAELPLTASSKIDIPKLREMT